MTQCVCLAYFLLFEHILKLKIGRPKNHARECAGDCFRIGRLSSGAKGKERRPLDNPTVKATN